MFPGMLRVAFPILLIAGCATAPLTAKQGAAMDSPIVQSGDAVLRARAEEVPVEMIPTPEFQAFIGEMVEAMRKAPGVGLAAPQLGKSWRVFVVEDPAALQTTLTAQEVIERERVPVPLRVFINPTVTPIGEAQVTFFEGCLSVSGFSALVTRAREVEVVAFDEKGAPVKWRVSGWPARILQHEMDHLNGALYIDRMHSRSFGSVEKNKARFGGKPIVEVLTVFGL